MAAANRHKTSQKLLGVLALIVLALGTISVGAVTFSRPDLPFANDTFADLWTRTDAPAVRANRTLYWGERPWFTDAEFYRQGQNGLRTVQYFDKGRMDVTNAADSNQLPAATSGLLVKELVSGRMELGDAAGDVDVRQPATIPVVGDATNNPSAPTYATFAALSTIDTDYHNPKRIGQPVDATLQANGVVGSRSELGANVTITMYDETTGHNLPSVFWEFMQRRGLVQTGSQVSNGVLVDWQALLGHPISDPYWVRAQVGGNERDVLVQLFERRVLTYTPGNRAGYEVELGNVGQQYVAWRYPQLGQPWIVRTPTPTLVYATSSSTGNGSTLHQWTPDGLSVALDTAPSNLLPSSVRRSWGNGTLWIAGDSTNGDGDHRQIYALPLDAQSSETSEEIITQTLRLTYSDGATNKNGPHAGALPNGAANEYQPAISPDGTKIAFISDRTGKPELFLMQWNSGNPVQLTNSDCVTATPAWSPDGHTLVWANNCDGDYELYSAELRYRDDSQSGLAASLTAVRKLTDNTSDDRFPTIAPNGRQIAWTSTRDGHSQLYLMNLDDSQPQHLLTSDADDEQPAWSPDGTTIAFASNRTGHSQIFTLTLKDSTITQLTQGDRDSQSPVWVR